MSRKSDYESMIETVMANHGITTYEFGRKTKHPAVFFTTPAGAKHNFVYPGTESDHRSLLNTRRDLRRKLRELGIQEKPGAAA